jgi:hypothetical protein
VWIGFNVFVLAMLAVDLGIFHREAHVVSMKEAAAWSIVWITLALLFNAGLAYLRGTQAGLEFLTGYLIEKALSVDNIFVFVLIFSYFNVPPRYQHRVLYFLLAGVITKFHYLKLGLSVVLVFVGTKMLLTDIYRIPIVVSLGVIATILATSIIASLLFPKAAEAHVLVEHDPLERGKPEPVFAPLEPDVACTHSGQGARAK